MPWEDASDCAEGKTSMRNSSAYGRLTRTGDFVFTELMNETAQICTVQVTKELRFLSTCVYPKGALP